MSPRVFARAQPCGDGRQGAPVPRRADQPPAMEHRGIGPVAPPTEAPTASPVSMLDATEHPPALGHPPSAGWESAKDMADRLGVAPELVGRVVVALGLHRPWPGLVRRVSRAATCFEGTITSPEFSPDAAARIERGLAGLVPVREDLP